MIKIEKGDAVTWRASGLFALQAGLVGQIAQGIAATGTADNEDVILVIPNTRPGHPCMRSMAVRRSDILSVNRESI
jgi:hypothetical protein